MTNRKIFIFLIILGIVSFAIPHVEAASKVRLFFQSEVEVSGSRLMLSQMVRMEGDAQLIQKLGKVDLGTAPQPGRKLTLTKDFLLGNLRQRGFNTQEIELVDFPSKGIIVKGAMQLVEEERAMQMVTDYIYSQIPPQIAKVDISLKTQFPKIALPPGDYQIEVGPNRSSKIWGLISLPIRIIMDDKEYDRETLSLDVRIYQKVFVAVKAVNRMDIITSDMLDQKIMDVTMLVGEPVEKSEDVIGRMATRSLTTGSVILRNYLEIPKLVHRNEKVTIDVYLGSIHIRAQGKALADGVLGDTIDVANLDSGIKVRAIVTGAGQVQARIE